MVLIRNVTNHFATEGYLAIAPELYHRTAPARFEGDYNVVFPHADRGFFCDERAAYQPAAARQSRALTLEF